MSIRKGGNGRAARSLAGPETLSGSRKPELAADQAPKSRICIIYPADPLGVIPGGIDTFIKGIVNWAPPDIEFRIVGITTDPAVPTGRWTTFTMSGDRRFEFYPAMAWTSPERQSTVPVVVRFVAALLRRKVEIAADVLEFHRIEPWFAFARDPRPKTLVMHQNMKDLKNLGSDIRWRYLPSLYFKLEDHVVPRMSSIFCVREDAAESYRQRFPELRQTIHFTPTWMNPEVFQPADEARRQSARTRLQRDYGFSDQDFVLITVGRLDRQKNPLMLLEAFRQLYRSMPDLRLLFVGDGVLRPEMERWIEGAGLEAKVRLAGVTPPAAIAEYLQAADLFVLSSAYEGMPIVVLEAMGCGLPVAATDVGEVARVVRPGINGELVSGQDAPSLANAIRHCRENIHRYRGKPCLDAVEPYTPRHVLKPIYDNYRRLAAQHGRRARGR